MLSRLKQNLASLITKTEIKPKGSQQKQLGDAGEAAAARFLDKERGMKILIRNWRSPKDRREEIDIVCKDGEVLVFVEVKSYPTNQLLRGYEVVNRHKKEILKRASREYLRGIGSRGNDMSYRLDVVVVERTDDGRLVPHHFENVSFGGD